MTISTTTNRADYIGNGAASVYAYPFKVFAAADIRVIVRDTDGVEAVLTLNVDYTVLVVGVDSGGDVTLTGSAEWLSGGNLKNNYTLTISRIVELLQPTSIANQGAFFPEIHEDTFDRLTMMAQQQQDSINRSLKLPESEEGLTELPGKEIRANRFMAFDNDGHPTIATFPIIGDTTIDALIAKVDDHEQALTVDVPNQFSQTLKVPEAEVADLPNAATRANKFLAFNGSGEPLASAGPVGEIPVSVFMEGLLGEESAADARAYLAVADSVVPVGTRMLFYQAAAPTGWTAVVVNNRFLRVVWAGTTGGTMGGTLGGSGVELTPTSTIPLRHLHSVAGHTHTITHRHTLPFYYTWVGQPLLRYPTETWSEGTETIVKNVINIQGGSVTNNIALPWAKSRNTDTANSGPVSLLTNVRLEDASFLYADVIVAEKA